MGFMKDFYTLAGIRESCRHYAAKPVEKEKLIALVEAARLSPSACNSQPWSFVVVQGPSRCSRVAKCLQDRRMNKFTDECPAFIIVVEEPARLISRIRDAVPSEQIYAPVDIGIAAAHICLQATDLGLSTCIMGWFDQTALREAAGLPGDKPIRLVIGVGYAADEKLREKVRKPLADLLQYVNDDE